VLVLASAAQRDERPTWNDSPKHSLIIDGLEPSQIPAGTYLTSETKT